MFALAAGILAFTFGCMSTVPGGKPYQFRESGIEELKTEPDDCQTYRGAGETDAEANAIWVRRLTSQAAGDEYKS